MKKIIFMLIALFAAATVMSCAKNSEQLRVGIVVKIGGIPWFNAMEAGIKEKAAELGVDAFMIGPTEADPAQQVRAIEDLIAQQVDVIGVVPNDPVALEPVLGKAREAGITVIAHESPAQVNADWDFEMLPAQGFGERHMQLLGEQMGGEGEYIVIIGGLTVPLHNVWADSAIAYQKLNFPNMKLIADKFGTGENVDDSFNTFLDVLRSNPNLKGVLGFGSQGPIGAARGVESKNLQGKVFVVGSFSPGQGQRLMENKSLIGGYMWNPRQAGQVFITLAKMIKDGAEIKQGVSVEGLGNVIVDEANRTLIGDQYQSIDPTTVASLAEMGL